MNTNQPKAQNIAIFGHSEYALMEAYLLSQHHQVSLVYRNQNQQKELNECIAYSQELIEQKSGLVDLKQISIDELKNNHSDAIIFFDGNCRDFLLLHQIIETSAINLIDCSSYDWQLENLKNFSELANYCVLAQYPQQGQLYSQLKERKHLIIGSHPKQRKQAEQLIQSIYKPYLAQDCTIKTAGIDSVYLSKFILNAQLAFRITVMNEASRVCELFGADIETIRECIALDSRLGSQYLKAGTGFGGTSFMRDLDYLASLLGESTTTSHSLFQDAIRVNEDQQEVLFRKLWRHFEMNLKGKKIAIWGLSYKPDTADISLSPAIKVLEILLVQQAKITAFDPLVQSIQLQEKFSKQEITAINLAKNPIEACKNADALLIFNELEQFKKVDLNQLKKQMKQAIIFDGRNLFDLAAMKQLGFEYFSIGRKKV